MRGTHRAVERVAFKWMLQVREARANLVAPAWSDQFNFNHIHAAGDNVAQNFPLTSTASFP